VLEVEEQRQHAGTEQRDAQAGQQRADAAMLAVAPAKQEDADDDHHAGHPAPEEQVDRDLPTPDANQGVDQLVVTRHEELAHGVLVRDRRHARRYVR